LFDNEFIFVEDPTETRDTPINSQFHFKII
jgi:hypothetical protein